MPCSEINPLPLSMPNTLLVSLYGELVSSALSSDLNKNSASFDLLSNLSCVIVWASSIFFIVLLSIITVSVEAALGSSDVYGLSKPFLFFAFTIFSKFWCSTSHCGVLALLCLHVGVLILETSAGVKSLIRNMSFSLIPTFSIVAGSKSFPALSANLCGIFGSVLVKNAPPRFEASKSTPCSKIASAPDLDVPCNCVPFGSSAITSVLPDLSPKYTLVPVSSIAAALPSGAISFAM